MSALAKDRGSGAPASLGRHLPLATTVVIAVAHFFAWREALGVSAFVWLGAAYAPLMLWATMHLRREEVLRDLMRPVAGDLTAGILGAALAVGALYAVARVGLRVAPSIVARDLRGIVAVAAPVQTTVRGVAIVAFSIVEEVVWRGAVSTALEERFGSARAPWVAGGLFVVALLPSMHPSLILAGVILAVVTAITRVRFRRLSVPLVVHAFFTWITVEMILPDLWGRIQALG